MYAPRFHTGRRALRGAALAAVVCVLLVIGSQGCGGGLPGAESPHATLILGTEVDVAQAQAGAEGATLVVDGTGGPLDGLTVEVPAGAYADARTFAISYRPILDYSLVGGGTVLSPLIDIENGGEYAEYLMTVVIPLTVPDGQSAMAFYYDEESGRVEGIPVLDQDATSLTIATRHFSGLFGASAPTSKLYQLDKPTGFEPGKDDWQFPNYGSYMTPRGNCSGMCLTAMWYYLEKTKKGQPTLRARATDSTMPGSATPDFWMDDTLAIRFVSTVQHDLQEAGYEQRSYAQMESFETWSPQRSFEAIANAINESGEPQLLGIRQKGSPDGHAIICYKIVGTTLYVADPNFPGDTTRKIVFDGNQFENYLSGDTKADQKEYDTVLFCGQTAVHLFDDLAKYWADFERGDVGSNLFEPYDVRLVKKDAAGNDERVYELAENKENHVTHSDLTVRLWPPGVVSDLGVRVFRADDLQNTLSLPLQLKPGMNRLGFEAAGSLSFFAEAGNPEGRNFLWRGFHWINVVLDDTSNQRTESHETYIGDGYFDDPNGELSMAWGTELAVSGMDSTAPIRVEIQYEWANRSVEEDAETIEEDPGADLDVRVEVRALGELGGLTDPMVIPLSGATMTRPSYEDAPFWTLSRDVQADIAAERPEWVGQPLQVKPIASFKNQGGSGYLPQPATTVIQIKLRVSYTPPSQ
jgi:hypothetical protein